MNRAVCERTCEPETDTNEGASASPVENVALQRVGGHAGQRGDTVASMYKVTHGVSFAALADCMLPSSSSNLSFSSSFSALLQETGHSQLPASVFPPLPSGSVNVGSTLDVCVCWKRGASHPAVLPTVSRRGAKLLSSASITAVLHDTHTHWCVTKTHLRDFTKLCLFKGV